MPRASQKSAMAQRAALIVEHEEGVIVALRGALNGRVAIEVARDVPSAISLLRDHNFSGLVLDLGLDDGSAFDLLRHLHRSHIDLPTVVVTQTLPPYVRDMLDDEQVKLVLRKPVDPKLLSTIVVGLCSVPA